MKSSASIGHPQHGFGLLPDPPGTSYKDIAEHRVGLILKNLALPEATNNVVHAPPVWSQGRTGSCTGHGFACCIATTLGARGVPMASPPLPRLLYALGRAVDRSNPSTPLVDVGASPNSLVRAIEKWGVVVEAESDGGREATSPDYTDHLEAHVNDEPKLGELTSGDRRIIRGFNLIWDAHPDKLDLFKTALASGHTVGVAVEAGSDAFQSFRGGTDDVLDYTGSNPDHWVCIIDYRHRAGNLEFLLQNSWGVGLWTPDGRAWVTSEFVKRGCYNSIVADLGA